MIKYGVVWWTWRRLSLFKIYFSSLALSYMFSFELDLTVIDKLQAWQIPDYCEILSWIEIHVIGYGIDVALGVVVVVD